MGPITFNILRFGVAVVCLTGLIGGAPANAIELSLDEVEAVAIENDPLIVKYQAQTSASMEETDAEGQLPDPKLILNLMNVPTTFDFGEEGMTQFQIGIRQELPKWGSRPAKQDRARLAAEVNRARAVARALDVLRGVRQAWMEVYFQASVSALIKESGDLSGQLLQITQYQFRSGRGTQQDVARAQLELSLVQDRAAKAAQDLDSAVADLEKWAGASVRQHTLTDTFPEMEPLPKFSELQAYIDAHPLIAASKAELSVTRQEVVIARTDYKPSFMVEGGYGVRGGGRSGVISAGVTIDLPLFAGHRQDKRLNARGHEVNVASDATENERRELKRVMESAFAKWTRLGERLATYESTIVPQAQQYSESARRAYQSRVSDFAELIRARANELETRIDALRIKVERAQSYYDLKYIAGETVQ